MLIRVADKAIKIASQRIYIQIAAYIVFDADTRIGREAVTIGEGDSTTVDLSHDRAIQIGPGVTGTAST